MKFREAPKISVWEDERLHTYGRKYIRRKRGFFRMKRKDMDGEIWKSNLEYNSSI